MMSIIGTQMMGMPQGLKASEGAAVLPWPNGSVLQAKLVPGEGGNGAAMLMIGGYRLRAEVPPNTQMGEVWLQIMGQTVPTQFRLMTQFQAHQLLMGMLRQQAAERSGQPPAGGADDGEQSPAHHGWAKMDGSGLTASLSTDINRLIIEDDGGGGGARGVVERQGDAEHFLLHGRLDLATLGSVAFALEGGEHEPLRLRLFARDGRAADLLRPGFFAWLQQQSVDNLESELLTGLPKQRSVLHDIVA
ncbi:MAG: hypothetical protein Q9M13_02090 [Mariprofundales bacterium]|nr:hypothetical protein [Mariprofundales bacterium]